MVAVTVVLPAARRVPPVEETVSQLEVLLTAQLIGTFPMFATEKVPVVTVNGPPTCPAEANAEEGVTLKIGVGAVELRVTLRSSIYTPVVG